MATFADALFAALRREEARGRGPDETAPAAPVMVDLHASVAASLAAADDRPAWAKALGLPARCDEAQVHRAFRRRAFETHPDRPGGSHDAFLAVRRARDEALAAVRTSARASAGVAATASATSYVQVVRAPRERANAPRTSVAM